MKRDSTRTSAPFSAGSGRTAVAVPDGACDCHIHIYDRRYPAAAGATLRPPDATPGDYRLLQARTGTTRVVVVTPSTYGSDNRPTLDALRVFGSSSRGVAVIDEKTTDAELEQFHAAGVRGVRLNLMQPDPCALSNLELLSARVAPLAWHLQLFAPADALAELAPRLRKLPIQLVFDHFGNIPPAAGTSHAVFALIASLMNEGRAWVKVSGAANVSVEGPPGFADLTNIARGYLRVAPGRVIWGSDWPHPSCKLPPDDAALLDLLSDWTQDGPTLRAILVDNPQLLYDF